MKASVRTPARVPIATIDAASARAAAWSCMNAPFPHFTSSITTSLPSASFLLMTEAEINGMLPMVAVTSRSAYSFLSAGTRESDWPMMLVPTSRNTALKASMSRSTR